WWAAACFAVHALLRRLFTSRVAWLGVAGFALAPCHALPLSWMANREEIGSTALGTVALTVYLRWREERRARDGILSLALFSVAALAGEYTLCFAGYAVAAELVIRRESIPRRLVGLACFALPLVGYAAIHQALRYGAFGIGYYHDPIGDLGAYAASAPRRLGVLFATAWLGVNDVAWLNESDWKIALLTLGAAAFLVVPVARMLRELDAPLRGRAVTMLMGSVLSMAPVMAVDASARLLQVPMIGVSAVVALLVDHAAGPPSSRSSWSSGSRSFTSSGRRWIRSLLRARRGPGPRPSRRGSARCRSGPTASRGGPSFAPTSRKRSSSRRSWSE